MNRRLCLFAIWNILSTAFKRNIHKWYSSANVKAEPLLFFEHCLSWQMENTDHSMSLALLKTINLWNSRLSTNRTVLTLKDITQHSLLITRGYGNAQSRLYCWLQFKLNRLSIVCYDIARKSDYNAYSARLQACCALTLRYTLFLCTTNNKCRIFRGWHWLETSECKMNEIEREKHFVLMTVVWATRVFVSVKIAAKMKSWESQQGNKCACYNKSTRWSTLLVSEGSSDRWHYEKFLVVEY